MHGPNFLFINVDQHRYDALGLTGNSFVKTPYLDELGSKGAFFENAFTPIPMCCPARQTLLSGLAPEVHGCLTNYNGAGHAVREFSSELPVWVRDLKELGYQTAYLGKWHVHPRLDPTHFGYEIYIPEGKYPFRRPGGINWKNLESIRGIDLVDEGSVETSRTHLFARDAVEILRRFESSGSPWHLRLDFTEPHLPCAPAGQFAEMFSPGEIPPWDNFADTLGDKPLIQKRHRQYWGVDTWDWGSWEKYLAGYYGIISQLDDALGRVFTFLDEKNLWKDTLVVYTSDHGDMSGSHGLFDKGGVLYDEAVRVPLIFRWDGAIQNGQLKDLVSHYLDLPPTLFELFGVQKPDHFQGISFARQLLGKPNPMARKCVCSSLHGQVFGLHSQRMIRDEKRKWIWNPTDLDEFYDLEKDPHELVNLALDSGRKSEIAKYRKKLYEEFSQLKDPFVETPWMRDFLLCESR